MRKITTSDILAVLALLVSLVCVLASRADAATWTVGPGASAGLPTRDYTTICAAITNSNTLSDDTINVDGADSSGNQILYKNESCAFTKNIVLVGVGAKRPHMTKDDNFTISQGFLRPSNPAGPTLGTPTQFSISNFEASNARCFDNCQPIWESYNVSMTVRNVYFHDNDNGILTGGQPSFPSDQRTQVVDIQNSEFAYNGTGDGQTHNIYVGGAATLIFKENYSHDSYGGQLLKSRAGVHYVLNNRLVDNTNTGFKTAVGWSNYKADFCNGGRVFFTGNIVRSAGAVQPPGFGGVNQTQVVYYSEGSLQNVYSDWYIAYNTFISERYDGNVVFLRNYYPTPTGTIKNNVFVNAGGGTATQLMYGSTPQTDPANNQYYSSLAAAGFVNAAELDYRLNTSSAIDAAVTIGLQPSGGGADSMVLEPTRQYVHPRSSIARTAVNGTLDMGALEKTLVGTASLDTPVLEAESEPGQVKLTWGVATYENNAITNYTLTKNGSTIYTGTAHTYTDTAVAADTSYTYVVTANATSGSKTSLSVISGMQRVASATLPSTGTGWHYISSSNQSAVCLPAQNCSGYWGYVASGAWDSTNGGLLVWGGDGATHQGNEVYEWRSSDLAWHRLNTADAVTWGQETANGNPNRPGPRYTYAAMGWLPTTGEMFQFGGQHGGGFTYNAWRWKRSNDTWTTNASPNNVSLGGNGYPLGPTAYDPTSSKAVVYAEVKLWEMNTTTGAFTALVTANRSAINTLAPEPTTQRLYMAGLGVLGYFNMASGASYAWSDVTDTSCSKMRYTRYPAFARDGNGKLVYWSGNDNNIITLDPATNTCTTQLVVGAPIDAQLGRMSGKFGYDATRQGFWAATSNTGNVAFLRTSSTPNCDDANLCTTDTYDGSQCVHTPVSCGAGQTCSAQTGQCVAIPHYTGGTLAIGGLVGP